MASTTEFPINQPSGSGYMLALLPAVLAIGIAVAGGVTGKAYWYAIAVVPAAVAVVLLYLGYGTKHMSITVSPTEIVFSRPKQSIPKSAIKRDAAQVIDLAKHPELNTALRTSGVEMADFKQGWFKLKNGEKALVLLNDEHHAIYIPTSDGYSLLVSPSSPSEFLARLNE